MWDDKAVLSFQMNTQAFTDQAISNHDYLGGAGSSAVDAPSSGRVSLGILSLAILGVMAFYVVTRARQF